MTNGYGWTEHWPELCSGGCDIARTWPREPRWSTFWWLPGWVGKGVDAP